MFITERADFDFKPVANGLVQLQGALLYNDPQIGFVYVEDGFLCDLASYRRIGRAVFDRLGPSMRPAVIHDKLYRTQPAGVTREIADRIYKEALLLEGASALSANVQWAGLRVGGWIAWNRHANRIARGGNGGDPRSAHRTTDTR